MQQRKVNLGAILKMRIQKLPITLVNQINAGEMIAGPASVVKELLENALDAKASLININIVDGGLNQIKISDNGDGIIAADLPLAISPHATSKIRCLDDLYSLTSMGFRGEALASIAACSYLTISSKTALQEVAQRLTVTNTGAVELSCCARSIGTTVDVRDIFYNTPVKKKFLKSIRSEFQAIDFVVRRFALSAPEVAINLFHNGKQCLKLLSASCDKTKILRIRKLFGSKFVENALHLDAEDAGIGLCGLIGSAAYQRSQNDKLWIYVNGRIVYDKLLNHAVKSAYQSLLYPGRFPACLLYLTLNPQEIDVNIHPTKHEVRFSAPRMIHSLIFSQIQKLLQLSPHQSSYLGTKLSLMTSEKQDTQYSYINKLSKHDAPLFIARWLPLNPVFFVVLLTGTSFLVNAVLLQRHWLSTILARQSLPLLARPLLVPIKYQSAMREPDELKLYIHGLHQVGITVNLLKEGGLLLLSTPVLVPHLQITEFLTAAFKLPSSKSLIDLLSEHQSFTATHALEEEVAELLAHIQTLDMESATVKTFVKAFSATHCHDFFAYQERHT